uniref:S-locus cysteine-rich protein SCR7 n=1 Tax=Capsella grandiflora TaxID=264402 RepID=A5A5D9_9BRAS|nr:S-locus cysteine-rich protein SCR7 [Capsella grandiflora]
MRCGIFFVVSYVLMSFLISHVQGVETQKWKKECRGNFPGRCEGKGDEQCRHDLTEDGNKPSQCHCTTHDLQRFCYCKYCKISV